MKYILLLLVVFTNSCYNNQSISKEQNAPCKSFYDKYLKEDIYTVVDKMPEFPGGYSKFMEFLRKNLKNIPQDTFQGLINFSFIVDREGKVTLIKIIDKTEAEYTPMEWEVIRVLSLMPDWDPGTCNNQKVHVLIKVPIRF